VEIAAEEDMQSDFGDLNVDGKPASGLASLPSRSSVATNFIAGNLERQVPGHWMCEGWRIAHLETAFRKGAIRIDFKPAMSFNEILEQLPNLTEHEKRQLWNILDQELADQGEESPEFLAELDARIRALDHDARTYSLDEARKMVRDTVTRARR